MPGIGIVGVGPYSWHSHLPNLRRQKIELAFAVDLEQNRQVVRAALDAAGFVKTPLILVPSNFKDERILPGVIQAQLKKTITNTHITKAILSCEPKARYAYLQFLLENNIACFCDKPLTATTNCTQTPSAAEALLEDFRSILALSRSSHGKPLVYLNMNRRLKKPFHDICEIVSSTSAQFDLPITDVNIDYSGGRFHMPYEFSALENHPYKYGYGMLLHSGFHFYDLLSWVLQSQCTTSSKRHQSFKIQSLARYPSDEVVSHNALTRQKLFSQESVDGSGTTSKYHHFGELDVFNMFQFLNSTGSAITTAKLSLRSSGLSMRRSTNSHFDPYAQMGRVRHEAVEITIDPVLRLYYRELQTSKIKTDQNYYETPVHELLIFKNPHLTGGAAFEKITYSEGTDIMMDTPLNLFLNDQALGLELETFSPSMDLFVSACIDLAKCRG